MRSPKQRFRWITLGVVALAAAAINATAWVAAQAALSEGISSFSGATTGAVALATNTSTGIAFEGVTGTVAGGRGVFGVGSNSLNASTGVRGSAYGPSSFGLYGEATNTTTTKPSYGLYAISKSGYGVYAVTSRSDVAALFAVNTATTAGVGVQGKSVGNAIVGQSTKANGVYGATTSCATCPFAAGVLGQDNGSGNDGVQGTSGNGFGVEGDSGSGIGVFAQSSSNSQPALYVNGGSPSSFATAGAPVVIVHYRGGAQTCGGLTNAKNDIMSIDQKGNMKLCGTLTASTPPLVVTRTTAGTAVFTYAARQSQPTIEDFGNGRLVGGQGFVRIDPAFAATLDPRASYLVFVTPRGDNRGLYVARQTASGFWVRESQGGRSTLAFDYRIVAKPADTQAGRLAPVPDQSALESPLVAGRKPSLLNPAAGVSEQLPMPTGR